MSNEPPKKWWRKYLFLLVVAGCYVIVFLWDQSIALDALKLSGKLLYQLLPILILVFVLIFFSNLLIRPDWVKKHVGKESGVRGWVVAVIGGVLSVGPVYPWYALLKDLREHGMRTALVAVFLYSRGIKLPLLPIMVHYFGLAYTVILSAYLILFSLLGGVMIERALGDYNHSTR